MNQPESKVSRRRVFAGAGAIGAAAVAAAALPGRADDAAPAVAPKPAPEKGGGYQLSEHVRRYYQTARV